MRSIETVIAVARTAVQHHFSDRAIEKVDARRTEDSDGDPVVFIYCQLDRYAPRDDINKYVGARNELVRALSDEEYPRLYVFDEVDALKPIAAA